MAQGQQVSTLSSKDGKDAMMPAASNYAEGLKAFHAGSFADAAEVLGRAQDQESSELWNDWGTAQFFCEDLEQAEDGFRRALELDKHNAEAAVNLVVLLVNQGRAAEAAPYMDSATPALSEIQRESTSALIKQSQPPALTTIQEFLNAVHRLPLIDKQLPLYRRKTLARTYFDSSSYVSACLRMLRQLPKELHTQAARQMGSLSGVNHQFGIVAAAYYLEINDPASAVPLLHQACDRNPADLYAEQLLIRCELAEAETKSLPHPTFSGLDEYLATSFCSKPWEHFEVLSDGAVYMCCSGWMPVPIGNLKNDSVLGIWNSQMAQDIRASVLDGSFKFCSKVHCPRIAGRELPRKAASGLVQIEDDFHKRQVPEPMQPVMASRETKCTSGPSLLVLSHDASCNLACPSCRNDFLMVAKQEQEALEAIQNRLIEEAFDGVRVLFLDGAGEVFYSKPSRNMLKKLTRERFPDLKLDIITNGLLFNRRTYEEFDLCGRVQAIRISMDAATEGTYKIVRRGGDFTRLLDNLKFIQELRHHGESFALNFLFVVSAYNFREMPEFVRLGRKFQATRVHFTAIRNLGHLTAEQFAPINIESPDHPEHAEFLDVLKAAEFDDPMVDSGSISHFRHSCKNELFSEK